MLDYLRFKEINDLFASGHPQRARHLLMEMQSRCIALRDEISMLKLRLQSLEDALNLSRNLAVENGFYWLMSNGLKQGPFCPRCYEHEGSLIHLEKNQHFLSCPCCQESYPLHRSENPSTENTTPGHARILRFARQI